MKSHRYSREFDQQVIEATEVALETIIDDYNQLNAALASAFEVMKFESDESSLVIDLFQSLIPHLTPEGKELMFEYLETSRERLDLSHESGVHRQFEDLVESVLNRRKSKKSE